VPYLPYHNYVRVELFSSRNNFVAHLYCALGAVAIILIQDFGFDCGGARGGFILSFVIRIRRQVIFYILSSIVPKMTTGNSLVCYSDSEPLSDVDVSDDSDASLE